MLKYIVFIVFLYISVNAEQFNAANLFNPADVSQFSKLKNNVIDPSEYLDKKTIKKMKGVFGNISREEAKNRIKTGYHDTKFLTKEEALSLIDILYDYLEKIDKPKNFLLYFTTENVPKHSMTEFLLGVSILQDNGINIMSKQYLIGPTKDLQKFLMSWHDYIANFPIKYQLNISKNFKLKLDPRFFQTLKIDKAPAMAYVTCSTIIPEPDKCKVKFLIRGDVTLHKFLKLIANDDKNFESYPKFLEANKIYKLSLDNDKREQKHEK